MVTSAAPTDQHCREMGLLIILAVAFLMCGSINREVPSHEYQPPYWKA